MSDVAHTPNGPVDLTRLGASAAVPLVGKDSQLSKHYFDQPNNRVIVISDDGTVEAERSLGDRTIGDWIRYVEDKRGWATGGSKGHELIDMLAQAVDA